MAKLDFEAIAPQFVVQDVKSTAEWYRDKLGFEILGYFFSEPPVYSIVQRGGVLIHFGRADAEQTFSNTSIRQMSMDAYVLISDVVGLYDDLRSRGVDMPYPPTERVYGRTEIEVTDCDGHKLIFGE